MEQITLYYGVRLYNNRIINQSLEGARSVTYSNINFNNGNGIVTSLTCNTLQYNNENNLKTSDFPSYLITETGTRWFVMSCIEQRLGQITLTLRRDFLSEYWDQLKDQPFLVDKASTIPANVSNAKFNKTTNLSQVKTSETLLNDREGSKGYLYAYIAKDMTTYDSTSNNKENFIPNRYNYDYKLDTMPTWLNKEFSLISNLKLQAYLFINNGGNYLVTYDGSNSVLYNSTIALEGYFYTSINSTYDKEGRISQFRNGLKALYSSISDELEKPGNIDFRSLVNTYADKIILVDSKRYKITLKLISSHYNSFNAFTRTQASTVTNGTGDVASFTIPSVLSTRTTQIYNTYFTYQLIATELVDTVISRPVPQMRTHTVDSSYDIICIPLGGTIKYQDSASSEVQTLEMTDVNSDLRVQVLKNLQITMSSNVYDIQWLPYSPLGDVIYQANDASQDGLVSFTKVTQGNTVVGLFVYLASAQFSKQLFTHSISLNESDNLEQRILNEETRYRLASPNYSSQFEFSIVKNGGVESWDLDVALKPYNPYIKIAPHFNGLYGQDFNDGRGLVLGGDYSLDQVNDAWQTYQVNNKNYELIFNRQIQSLDLQMQYQNRLDSQANITDWLGAFTGASSAGVEGALSGASYGGVVGAAISGGVSGGLSLGAGIVDAIYGQQNRAMAREIREDAKQAKIDQYQYQLGNIKAIPDTLTKIATFNPNFKIFPIVEYYTCTIQEDLNLRNSIKYNGIDINLMDTLADYDKGFVSGVILQFPSTLNINQQEAQVINEELQKGVYIKEV